MEGPSLFAWFLFVFPLVGLVGGIVAGIVKTRGQQRLVELAQRERLAAIEKGIDPASLPSLSVWGRAGVAPFLTPRQADMRRAQGLLIVGLVLSAFGLGLSVMLLLLPDAEANSAWASGIIPILIGLALAASSAIVRRQAPGESDSSGEPRT